MEKKHPVVITSKIVGEPTTTVLVGQTLSEMIDAENFLINLGYVLDQTVVNGQQQISVWIRKPANAS